MAFKSLLLTLALAHVSADGDESEDHGDCTWTGTADFLNYGVNSGGCYVCEAYQDDAATLTAFCRELCLSDPSCKSFEVAPGSAAYETYVAGVGAGIQCCIEYADASETAFPNTWMAASDFTGDCVSGDWDYSGEASLWTTYAPDDRAACASDAAVAAEAAAAVADGTCVWIDPVPFLEWPIADNDDTTFEEAEAASTGNWFRAGCPPPVEDEVPDWTLPVEDEPAGPDHGDEHDHGDESEFSAEEESDAAAAGARGAIAAGVVATAAAAAAFL